MGSSSHEIHSLTGVGDGARSDDRPTRDAVQAGCQTFDSGIIFPFTGDYCRVEWTGRNQIK